MRRWILGVTTVSALLLAPLPVAGATCPGDFHLHSIGDDDHEHGDHVHVGVRMDEVDRNGNGLICVKHVSPDGAIHVHIDDEVP